MGSLKPIKEMPEYIQGYHDGYKEGYAKALEQLNALNNQTEQKYLIFKNNWRDLVDKINNEVDKDGWCRLVVTKEEALNMKKFFDSLD